jgi:hypothetical protein
VLSRYGYDIYIACTSVDTRYAKWRYQLIDDYQQIERVFAYELYHQIRLLMLKNEGRYDQLQLNGEISKVDRSLYLEGCGYSGDDRAIMEKLGKSLRVNPDLVLHKAQNNREFAWQKAIVEIKSGDDTTSDDIYDIIKLLNFVEQLNFENAIFVAVNKNRQQLSNNIRASFLNTVRESYSRCSIFFYEGDALNNNNFFSPRVNIKSIEEIINRI